MSTVDLLKEVKSLEDTLKCNVCNKLLEDPLLIVKCGHTTCKACFSKHQDNACPICETPLNTKDSLEDKQLKELLVHLKKLKMILKGEKKAPEDNVSLENNSKTAEKSKQMRVSFEKAITCKTNEKLSPLHCSTPKDTRQRLSSKITSAKNSTEIEDIIQETPENRNDKSLSSTSNRRRKESENKRLSTSVSSPGTPLSNASPLGNLNKKNPKGETLLHRAVIKGDISKVLDLINKGASVNTQDNNGWTPLHEASNHGFVEIAKLLLDHGALLNVPSLKDNITPLHDALLNNQMEIAILLVSRGADLLAKASFGYNALDLCKSDEDRRILTEACSPFIEANTIMPESKVTEVNSDKIVFLYSNLNDEQKLKLQKCAQLLKAEIVEDFKPDVTHIVTSCDNMGNCTRTMKILLGMLSGKWLINYQWIEVCLEYKRRVEEEVFEVQGTKNQPNTQGPTRARKNFLQKFPPLFDGFNFYLHGTFTKPTPLREDLSNLIHLGGGKLLSREPKRETVSAETFMIPYHAADTPLENTSHLILFQDKPPRDTHINSNHICTTQVTWLISCISEFALLEPKQITVNNK